MFGINLSPLEFDMYSPTSAVLSQLCYQDRTHELQAYLPVDVIRNLIIPELSSRQFILKFTSDINTSAFCITGENNALDSRIWLTVGMCENSQLGTIVTHGVISRGMLNPFALKLQDRYGTIIKLMDA